MNLEDLGLGGHSPPLCSPWRSLRTQHCTPQAWAQVENSSCGQWGFELCRTMILIYITEA